MFQEASRIRFFLLLWGRPRFPVLARVRRPVIKEEMMQSRLSIAAVIAVAAAAALSAHVMVSPTQSKSGATQKYEVRVHNEAKVAATAVDVDIPDGVTVTDVVKPASGAFTTKKTGDRITSITWQIEVQPSKYVALPFTATNPANAPELRWSLHEHLADGTTIDWSDKPGSKEKGSVTKLTAAAR